MARLNVEEEQVGTLFKNIAFFVKQRVPARNSLVNSIERNGGKVVKLQAQADITIEDDARKDCENDSISWKWVVESIKHASLQEKDQWRAGPKGNAPRPVGALKRPKSGRNPYTLEDDIYVYRFVNDPKRAAMSDKGNAMYQELEKEV